jgi:hypothetical protein
MTVNALASFAQNWLETGSSRKKEMLVTQGAGWTKNGPSPNRVYASFTPSDLLANWIEGFIPFPRTEYSQKAKLLPDR